jgi:hypothetical protein
VGSAMVRLSVIPINRILGEEHDVGEGGVFKVLQQPVSNLLADVVALFTGNPGVLKQESGENGVLGLSGQKPVLRLFAPAKDMGMTIHGGIVAVGRIWFTFDEVVAVH